MAFSYKHGREVVHITTALLWNSTTQLGGFLLEFQGLFLINYVVMDAIQFVQLEVIDKVPGVVRSTICGYAVDNKVN